MSQIVAVGKEDRPFVGRENEQKEYWDFIAGKSDEPWLLVISGLGGIGKSMLLNTLYQQTLERHAPPDTFAILLNFDTGTSTELPLQTDSRRLGSSLQTRSPQPDASLRTDPLLFLNELTHLLRPHCDSEQFKAFTETLQKGRIQLAQFKEGVEQSSQSFTREHGMQPPSDARQKIRFAELEVNRQVRESVTEAFYRQVDTFQPERLVIMLDTCELLNDSGSWIFSNWLINEFLPELHSRMWRKPCFVVMASRIPPDSEVIDEYDQQHLVLSMLEESAVDAYLERMGMLDPSLRQSVYKITRGHALCVAIIGQFYQNIGQEALQAIDTSVLQTEFDENASLELINERILNKLDNPFKDLTQYGVLLRIFTLPLLRTVFPELLPEANAKEIFDQFIRYPYIESRGNYRYAFHELIREVLAKNTQKNDLARWKQFHKRVLDYYTARESSFHSMDWYYHNLSYEEVQGMLDWRKALQESRDRGDTQRVSSLLQITDDVALNLTTLSRAECAYEWGLLSIDRRQPLDKALEKFEESLRLYGQVEDHPEEVRLGEANVLQLKGDVLQSKVQLDKALNSYHDALDLLQQDEQRSIEVEAQVLKKIGDVHQLRGNLDDLSSALENYKQALSFFRQVGDSLQAAQVLKNMGDVQQQLHRLLRNLEDLKTALEDYEQALGLFRQAKRRSQEDEAKVLEAIGDIHWLRYQSSGSRQDLDLATENYQLAFGLFSDNTNARKRLKEKVEAQKQKKELTGPQSGDIRATLALSQAEAQAGGSRTLTLPGGRRITVPVPAGIRNGVEIRLRGQGEPAWSGGPVSDLILTVFIAPSSPDSWAQPREGVSPWGQQGNQPAAPTISGSGGGSGQSWSQTGQVADQWGQSVQIAQQGAWTPGVQPPPSQKRSSTRTILLFGLLFLFLLGSIGGFLVVFQRNDASLQPNPTAQAQATATSQVQATATAFPNPYSSTINGASLVLADPLRDNSMGINWDETASCAFTGGGYQASIAQPNTFISCLAQNLDFSDFAYEVQMSIVKGNGGGIVFRARQGNQYSFLINKNGFYSLSVFFGNEGNLSHLLADGISTAIHKGLNQPNLIAIVANGSVLNLYVNQQLIDTIHDTTYSQGQIGVAAVDYIEPTKVIFTNAKVWKI